MPIRPDLIVYSRENEPSLVVEVKNKRGASTDWATRFRRNLLHHGGFPAARYFLLVTPDQLYLWKDDLRDPNAVPQQWPTREALSIFFDVLPSDKLDEITLELVTQAWLSSLTEPTTRPDDLDDWIVNSGLYESIKGGRVKLQPAA